MATSDVKLSELVTAGGCAAKYAAGRLEELLAGFVPPEAENLLVGLSPADDAAVYKLDDERALVFTVDFFPPMVDDPRDFGSIAAANALNDVFAMGGSPLLALSVAAFPEELPVSVLAEILAGADETVRAAGALLAGGHTIRDNEPKYGLAVVGTAHPDAIWAKSNAAPGRRALPHEASRHGSRPPRREAGAGRRGRARGGGALDADAEPRGGGRRSPLPAQRRHRRHGLRPAGARVGDGGPERRADRPRRGRAACAPRRARGGARGRGHGRRPAQPRVRGRARRRRGRGRRGRRRAGLGPSDRRRPARLAAEGARRRAAGDVRRRRPLPHSHRLR